MASPRILVVDDDPNHCLVTQRLLAEQGYDVDIAHDALGALQLFGEHTHDLVILDYRMPDMDGLDLFETIKRQWSGVTVIFHTAYATIDLVNSALDAGARRVIPKDSDNAEVLDVVNEVLAQGIR